MTEEEMQHIQDIIEEIQFEKSEDHFNMLKDKIEWLIKENRKGWEIVDIAIKERDHYIADRDALQARIDSANAVLHRGAYDAILAGIDPNERDFLEWIIDDAANALEGITIEITE